MKKPLRLQSMFSGIGGLDLGIEHALDVVTVAQCELAPFARSVLARHWPDAELTEDVLELSAIDSLDVLAAGFPCQDASKANPKGQAGLKGKKTGLWSEVRRVIDEGGPRLVVLENVRNLLNVGFDVVLDDLDKLGYDVRWGVWTVAAVGGPVCRERLIALALKRGESAAELPVKAPSASPWASGLGELPEHVSGAWRVYDEEWPEKQEDTTKRAKACGNAVCPWMATTAIVQTLAVWNEVGGPLKLKKGKLPAWGALEDGELLEVEPLAKPPSYAKDFKRGDFVRWLDGAQCNPWNGTLQPTLGRVVYANGDFLDIELPGGSVEPFDAYDVKRWWPSPTAHDGQDSNSTAQYKRTSPGLPSFTDGIACPETSEWAMGLPLGWTRDPELSARERARFF